MSDILFLLDAVFYNATGILFVALGAYVLIRASGYPDLTIDGSFTIGAALYAVAITNEWPTAIALVLAMLGGAFGGAMTWAINSLLGVGKVIASVLTMLILLLSAPIITNGATRSLLARETIHADIQQLDASITASLLDAVPFRLHIVFSGAWLTVFVAFALVTFLALRHPIGIRLRYIGDSIAPNLINSTARRFLLLGGLASGNALIGLGGAIEAQRRGAYTSNMGLGMLLVALAILVLGEALIKSVRRRDYLYLRERAIGVVIGCLVYTAGIQLLLFLPLPAIDLRLLTAVFLLILLAFAGRFHSSSTKLF